MAKPTGHRTVRVVVVVVVVGLLLGHDLEGRHKFNSTLVVCSFPSYLPPIIFFAVVYVTINEDLLLLHQNYL